MWKMLRTSISALALGLAGAATAQDVDRMDAASAAALEMAELQQRVSETYIFVFKDSMARGRVDGEARAMVQRMGGEIQDVWSDSIRGFSARMSARDAARLARNPSIAYYEPDSIFSLQGFEVNQAPDGRGRPGDGEFTALAQTVDWGVSRVNGPMDASGFNTYAFVIDTGVDLDHPDLTIDVANSRSCITGNTNPNDFNGHGTHVAGTIAARNNTIGTVGVAAGATVVSARVLNASGSGSTSNIITCVNFVAGISIPGDVANLSLGGGISTALDDAVRALGQRGVFVTIAAGNSTAFAGNTSPARATGPNLYTVSAIDINDELASFSNWGNPPVRCADPGVNILSLWNNGGTMFLSGTSMAAPHLAGILLVRGGTALNGGTVSWDRDSTPDTICVK